jgi:hypothetical protein
MTSGVYERTPETREILSKASRNSEAIKAKNEAQRGVPRSPEDCVAMSKTMKNSAAVKANIDKMRGGNDICDHHYIYDHNDLSLNTIKMTRSDHQKLHLLLKKLGYIIPHINQ